MTIVIKRRREVNNKIELSWPILLGCESFITYMLEDHCRKIWNIEYFRYLQGQASTFFFSLYTYNYLNTTLNWEKKNTSKPLQPSAKTKAHNIEFISSHTYLYDISLQNIQIRDCTIRNGFPTAKTVLNTLSDECTTLASDFFKILTSIEAKDLWES